MNQERIELLKKYHTEDPRDPFPLYGLAMEYMQEAPAQAAELFDQVLTQHPKYLPVYYTAALFFGEQNNESKAITLLKKGIELSLEQHNEKATRELRAALEQLEF